MSCYSDVIALRHPEKGAVQVNKLLVKHFFKHFPGFVGGNLLDTMIFSEVFGFESAALESR